VRTLAACSCVRSRPCPACRAWDELAATLTACRRGRRINRTRLHGALACIVPRPSRFDLLARRVASVDIVLGLRS
jgi:hypothetical protein